MGANEQDVMKMPKRKASAAKWARIAGWLALLVGIFLLAKALPVGAYYEELRNWIEGLGVVGYLAFIVIYIFAVVFMLPGSILSLAAGAIFGILKGTVIVSVASTTGVALTFLISRFLFRDRFTREFAGNAKAMAIDRAIGEKGWRIVLLLRLSPLFPFNLQNYLYGVTSVRFWPCVLASWVGMLPGTVMYVYLGKVFGVAALESDRERTTGEWMIFGVGLAVTVIVTLYITRIATRAVKEQTANPSTGNAATTVQSEHVSKGFTGGTFALIGASIILLAAGIAANVIEFGPPKVKMRETIADTGKDGAFDHSQFDAILKAHVDAHGWVDYAGVQADAAKLDAYIESLGAVDFDELGRDERLALLINAYNACTLRLILDYFDGGKLQSIFDIPESRRWKDERWKIGANVWSLDQIEHEQIRPNFKEPRIHFAVVCAAVSCPKLRNEAYAAAQLESQLADQTAYTHTHERWLRYDADANHVALTMLYHPTWYADDFTQVADSVLDYVAQFSQPVREAMASGNRPSVDYIEYSWKLNDIRNRPRPDVP